MKKIIGKFLMTMGILLAFCLQVLSTHALCLYDPNFPTRECDDTPASSQKYPEVCAVLNRPLKQGDVGQDVKRLQIVLGQEGIAYLAATGYYGPATAASVKVFQQRNGIYPVGKVGPQTLRFMRSLWCGDIGLQPGIPTTPLNPPVNSGNPEVSIQPISSTANNITLSWNTNAVNSCSIQQDNYGFQSVQTVGQQTFTLFGESRFTLKCTSFNGREYSKQIIVRPNQPISNLSTLNVSINPSQVIVGQQATIYWTSQNTSYCTSNIPGYSSNLQISGSAPITVTSGYQAYTVTCYNQTGQSMSKSIRVNSPQGLAPSINAFNGGMYPGGEVGICQVGALSPCNGSGYLSWTTTNVISCNITGGNLNNLSVQTNGGINISPTTTTSYTLKCVGADGQSTSSNTTVIVTSVSQGTIIITSNLTSIFPGQAVTLSWTGPQLSSVSYQCSLTGGGLYLQNQAPSGTYTVYPTTTTTYTLQCSGTSNNSGVPLTTNTSSSVTVSVSSFN